MKTITAIIILTLTASTCFAQPTIVWDPNDNIESLTDPNNMIVICTIEISKQSLKAMDVLGYDLQRIFDMGGFGRMLERLIIRAKNSFIENKTVTEVENMSKK